MAKANHLAQMIEHAEEQIAKMEEGIATGGLSPEAETEALQTIEAMLGKIERLNSYKMRIENVKGKGKK